MYPNSCLSSCCRFVDCRNPVLRRAACAVVGQLQGFNTKTSACGTSRARVKRRWASTLRGHAEWTDIVAGGRGGREATGARIAFVWPAVFVLHTAGTRPELPVRPHVGFLNESAAASRRCRVQYGILNSARRI